MGRFGVTPKKALGWLPAMFSTPFANISKIARYASVGEEVSKITEAAMRGEINLARLVFFGVRIQL